jgi:soluble lytic murein transglycosylase
LKRYILIGFVFTFIFSLTSCSADTALGSKKSASFYQGLLAKADDDLPRAEHLFETALDSPNSFIRTTAAEELLDLLYRGDGLPPRLLARLKKAAPDPWNRGFALLAKPQKKEALAFFLSPVPQEQGTAFRYFLGEFRSAHPDFFTPEEAAAIDGHFAAARSRFAEALAFFRIALAGQPEIFLQYPDLPGDLGRSFQYTSTGNEGIDLFEAWERSLTEDKNSALRFTLPFYAGRIARARRQHARGTEFFTRALPFAPDPVQSDACMWYILDITLSADPEKAAALIKDYIPQWNDGAYFADILDRLSRYLTQKRRWNDLADVFTVLQSASAGASAAQYACILGRAVSEGLMPPDAASPTASSAADRNEAANRFFRIAYDTSQNSFYYRALSASFLGEPELLRNSLLLQTPAKNELPAGDRWEFLLGFFEWDAAAFAPAYIDRFTAGTDPAGPELSTAELRILAQKLEGADLYADAIRLVSRYMNRSGYELTRTDLELCYPRPFRETVEENARRAGLRPELLYGLIRTESAFQSGIVSRAGAVGLTQLMPATAEEMAVRIKRSGGPEYPSPLDLTESAANIHIGAVYLAYLMDRMENPVLAILAYNGGMNRVRRWRAAEAAPAAAGIKLPADLFLETVEYAETREYGRKVLSAAAIYGYLYYDLKMDSFFSDIR